MAHCMVLVYDLKVFSDLVTYENEHTVNSRENSKATLNSDWSTTTDMHNVRALVNIDVNVLHTEYR